MGAAAAFVSRPTEIEKANGGGGGDQPSSGGRKTGVRERGVWEMMVMVVWKCEVMREGRRRWRKKGKDWEKKERRKKWLYMIHMVLIMLVGVEEVMRRRELGIKEKIGINLT